MAERTPGGLTCEEALSEAMRRQKKTGNQCAVASDPRDFNDKKYFVVELAENQEGQMVEIPTEET